MNRRDFIYCAACIFAGCTLLKLNMSNYQKMQESAIPKFSIAMSSHCNLNCKCCDTYSPLANPEFVTLKQLTNDLKKLKKLYGNTDTFNCCLMGGEPLLNPEFNDIVKQIYKLFPNGYKSILTNGILLDKQNDEFWKLIKENNIHLGITKYPIDIDREKYEKIAQNYGIPINYCFVETKKLYSLKTKKVIKENFIQSGDPWSKNIIDLSGSQDYKEKLKTCPHRKIHVYVRGNIYSCYLHAYISAFRDFFKVDIPITENDYLRIADAKNKEEINDFLERPKELCRFCKQCHNTCHGGKPLEWGFSERKITEWT